METDAKDVKQDGARRDALDETRLVYVPREDATPEGELAALTAAYSFVIRCHEAKRESPEPTAARKEPSMGP